MDHRPGLSLPVQEWAAPCWIGGLVKEREPQHPLRAWLSGPGGQAGSMSGFSHCRYPGAQCRGWRKQRSATSQLMKEMNLCLAE